MLRHMDIVTSGLIVYHCECHVRLPPGEATIHTVIADEIINPVRSAPKLQRWLIIPVEIKAREFSAKLLLARAAALAGFRVILGERYAVQRRLPACPRGIYFTKDITMPVESLYRQIRELGHSLVAVDEEALVYYSRDIYRQRRFHAPTCALANALFAWGEDNAELWRETPGFPGTPIHITGNPRFDLLRRDFRYLYTKDLESIRNRHGDYVLINTNFGHVNPNHPKSHKLPDPSELAEAIKKRGGKMPRSYDPKLAQHRNLLYREFLDMVPRLVAAMPGRRFVLRPHPNENVQTWEKLLAPYANVSVVFEGPVISWILGATALVHNGCTTAVEALRLEVPAIAYRSVRNDAYETSLPNDLSHEVTSIEDLVDALERAYAGTLDQDEPYLERRDALARHFITAGEGPLAVQRIVTILRELPSGRKPSAFTRASAAWTLARMAWKRARKQTHMGALWQSRNEHIFPATHREEVSRRLDDFAAVLPAEGALSIKEMAPNLFRIETAT
jgi:surface carbohydrate biosynthesis protein